MFTPAYRNLPADAGGVVLHVPEGFALGLVAVLLVRALVLVEIALALVLVGVAPAFVVLWVVRALVLIWVEWVLVLVLLAHRPVVGGVLVLSVTATHCE